MAGDLCDSFGWGSVYNAKQQACDPRASHKLKIPNYLDQAALGRFLKSACTFVDTPINMFMILRDPFQKK